MLIESRAPHHVWSEDNLTGAGLGPGRRVSCRGPVLRLVIHVA